MNVYGTVVYVLLGAVRMYVVDACFSYRKKKKRTRRRMSSDECVWYGSIHATWYCTCVCVYSSRCVLFLQKEGGGGGGSNQ